MVYNADTAAANALDDYEEGSWTLLDIRRNDGTVSAFTDGTGQLLITIFW